MLSQRGPSAADRIQDTCRYQSLCINSDLLACRVLPVLILLVLGCGSENYSEDFERHSNYSWPLSNLWLSLNQRIQSGMSSETRSQGISAWWVGWVKRDYPWCLCQAELLPSRPCCSHTLALLSFKSKIFKSRMRGEKARDAQQQKKEWNDHFLIYKKASRNKCWFMLTKPRLVFAGGDWVSPWAVCDELSALCTVSRAWASPGTPETWQKCC